MPVLELNLLAVATGKDESRDWLCDDMVGVLLLREVVLVAGWSLGLGCIAVGRLVGLLRINSRSDGRRTGASADRRREMSTYDGPGNAGAGCDDGGNWSWRVVAGGGTSRKSADATDPSATAGRRASASGRGRSQVTVDFIVGRLLESVHSLGGGGSTGRYGGLDCVSGRVAILDYLVSGRVRACDEDCRGDCSGGRRA